MRTMTNAAMRNRNVAALTRKTWATEKPITASTAASAGPSTRLPLSTAELRLIAPARSARSTSSGMLAWNAGALRALAMPVSSDRAVQRPQRAVRGDERGQPDR